MNDLAPEGRLVFEVRLNRLVEVSRANHYTVELLVSQLIAVQISHTDAPSARTHVIGRLYADHFAAVNDVLSQIERFCVALQVFELGDETASLVIGR